MTCSIDAKQHLVIFKTAEKLLKPAAASSEWDIHFESVVLRSILTEHLQICLGFHLEMEVPLPL